MGLALVSEVGHAVAPGAAFAALTVNTGDTFTVPNFNQGSPAYLVAGFSVSVGAGTYRIRSPRLHDQVQGIRMQRLASYSAFLTPPGPLQPLYPSDVLTEEVTGDAANNAIAGHLNFFQDLPGVSARLHSWPEIASAIRNVITQEVDPTTGATNGDYGAGRAINADFDVLKAGVDYALLGFTSEQSNIVVGITGPDLGNQRIALPVGTTSPRSARYFIDLAQETGLPLIPVINANNKGVTQVSACQNAAAGAVNVGLVLAELGS